MNANRRKEIRVVIDKMLECSDVLDSLKHDEVSYYEQGEKQDKKSEYAIVFIDDAIHRLEKSIADLIESIKEYTT